MRTHVALASLAALLAAGCGAPSQEQANRGEETEAVARAPSAAPSPPAPPHDAPWSATGYALNGAAPVWGGSLTGTTVRYMTPDDQFGDVIETQVAYTPDAETYSGAWRGAPFVLTIRRRSCTDGLSDRVYPFAVDLRARGGTRRGCADPQ